MKKIENTVIGLILIIIGVIIGLNAFHITNMIYSLMDGGHYLLLFLVFLVYLKIKIKQETS